MMAVGQENRACHGRQQRPKMNRFKALGPFICNPGEIFITPMKLQQGQVWKCQAEFVRIVQLDRLEVRYKSATNLQFTDGTHQHTSKKDFCRLLKGATLMAPKQQSQAEPTQRGAKPPTQNTQPAPPSGAGFIKDNPPSP